MSCVGPIGNTHASWGELGKPRPRKKVKLCLDCPAQIERGKRCGPCSDAHNTAKHVEWQKLHRRRKAR